MSSLPRALVTALLAWVCASRVAGGQHPTTADGWADSARVEIESAVARRDIARLDAAELLLDRALTAFPANPLLLHYKGYALYREVALLEALGRRKETRPLLDEARQALDRSAAKLALAETYALQSTILGRQVGASSNPLAGMWLGPKSSTAMDRALELAPENPRVWLLRGVNARYTPKRWGGGLDKAERYVQQAIVLFATDRPARPLPAWGRADAYIWLGQIHQQQNKPDAARAAFERALALQPENQWLRQRLVAISSPPR